jgi:7,8-dihydropterin-6-yl-methyl-4-(beta-D-ribofuranosyl)aminobenzene 5'-phosphate synthase
MAPSRTVSGAVAAGGLLATVVGLAARYARHQRQIEQTSLTEVSTRLDSIGEVDQLSIVPLVERLAVEGGLRGEPGVSYLVRAGAAKLLFDAGLNARAETRSALVHNADALGLDLQDLDGVVISHSHADHVGGPLRQFRRTFALSAEPLEPRGLPAYVPTEMRHDRADVMVTAGPRVVAQGVAVLPPLNANMFWFGPVAEQALVINVRGFGLVLVSGCGHPRIERMLAVTERVLDVPIKGIVGGLHLPVHPFGTPLLLQGTLGNPNWPWKPMSEQDVVTVIREITLRGPHFVALSSHDSTPWTYDAFGTAFGDQYRTLHVGDELVISAGGALCRPFDKGRQVRPA